MLAVWGRLSQEGSSHDGTTIGLRRRREGGRTRKWASTRRRPTTTRMLGVLGDVFPWKLDERDQQLGRVLLVDDSRCLADCSTVRKLSGGRAEGPLEFPLVFEAGAEDGVDGAAQLGECGVTWPVDVGGDLVTYVEASSLANCQLTAFDVTP